MEKQIQQMHSLRNKLQKNLTLNRTHGKYNTQDINFEDQ